MQLLNVYYNTNLSLQGIVVVFLGNFQKKEKL